MGYIIYAWLENGNPRLQIVDAQSQAVRVSWEYHNQGEGMPNDKKEIQRLFRDLLLLSCEQEVEHCRIFGAGLMSLSSDR